MTQSIPDSVLDDILTLQLTVAWAGEGLCEPKRLDWWKTDVIDEMGGGDQALDLGGSQVLAVTKLGVGPAARRGRAPR